MKDNSKYTIDIEEILKARVKRKLPGFVIRFLKRRIHQDDVNNVIMNVEHPHGVKFFGETLEQLDIKYTVRGAENLDPSNVALFAANHPLGGPEALIIGDVMYQYFGESFRVPVNYILAHLPPLAEFFVPVNAISARQSRDISENITKMFNSDHQVLVYPAGKCARRKGGKVCEMDWKKMFITQARKYQRDVVPVHMSGRNSRLFYFLTRLSEILRMKVNIGMFMLVDELFKQKYKSFVITFGEPIPWQTFDKSKTDLEWAEWVKQKVAKLEEGNGEKSNM
ncbi:MAG: 1-acyl-sn-glycerol-3-phosphate acyltransferase [bacterium]